MSEKWYPIGRINFSKAQMWFLVRHLSELKVGDYPERPGDYVREVKMSCKLARVQNYDGLCVNCPFIPCLNPRERTPNRIQKERNINKVLEIAAEVEVRLSLVMDYISGWQRPTKRIGRNGYRKRIPKK